MNIEIWCVGGLRERHWREAAAEYEKRLAPYCKLSAREHKDGDRLAAALAGASAASSAASPAPGTGVPRSGAAAAKGGAYVVALDVRGRRLSSEGLSETLASLALAGRSRAIFLIGGAEGLPPEAIAAADLRLSFSDMTFPHQLMRVILLEQLYRAFKILKGEPYHK